ncbi:unnamed protein product [Spirodela intermedia]|uniref:Protein phosphatase n=1 Tax=Spirodela intermedia TaxID=51605 RepID=A0A7I8K8X0_SPIIN|nr:unnamed protein product [Spirodela intermedia]
MPSTYLLRQKGLRNFSKLAQGSEKLSLAGISLFSSEQTSSSFVKIISSDPVLGSPLNIARDRCVVDQRKAISVVGIITRSLSGPLVPGSSCQPCYYISDLLSSEPRRRSLQSPLQRSLMTACSSLLGRVELSAQNRMSLNRKSGQAMNFVVRIDASDYKKRIDCLIRVCGSLKNQEPRGNNMIYKCFWSGADGKGWSRNPFSETGTKDFHSSTGTSYSAGAATDVSFHGTTREEQFDSSTGSSDQKMVGDRTLKLLSGSCYLPHPAKEETGGEDAHFICIDEQAIGVADGVGGWADLGVDAGKYARELMSHSVSAIQEEPKGSVDPGRVLEKAYSSTKSRGSSTACIIALTNQGVHAVNLGDSGFIVVREGCTIFRSPVQQHDFNFTYQLESGNGSDLPSAAQVFTFPVAPGDVIIAGTDGLFDNLYNNEITAVVVHAVRAGLGPQVTAQKIAALARQRAQDKNRQTPFATAAQDAGYRYHGGKLDDITVVVSYITASDK